MRRRKYNLANYRLATMEMGLLYPVQCLEVLPGDTLQLSSSAFIRLSPMVAPVMHRINVRLHHWFVPNRILWEGWEDFITGGPDNDVTTEVPTLVHDGQKKALLDYLGVPPTAGVEVNALPVRAYNLIFNEFYRDQDLVNEYSLDDVTLKRCSWRKDYFTTARPWPQKGPDIVVPLGDTAPVEFNIDQDNLMVNPLNLDTGRLFGSSSNPTATNLNAEVSAMQDNGTVHLNPSAMGAYADLSQALGINVNDLRAYLSLQRLAEARARFGSRYTEYLQYLGVRPRDARIQRPEFLGGGRSNLEISEVLQTAQDQDSPVGTLRGHGITAFRTRRTRRFIEEHGYVLTLMSVVPESLYQDGVARHFLKRDRWDYWQPEMQHIGQQPVKRGEVYADGVDDQEVFGYSDRYAEYQSEPSKVTGEFRDLMDYWHLARKFEDPPALNQTFIECNPSRRIFAEQTQDPLWVAVNNRTVARRMVMPAAIGRIK